MALALLVVAAFGALAAVVVARGDDTQTLVATRVRIVHVVRPPLATTTALPTAPVVPTVTIAPPNRSGPTSALTPWPEADGYTVVLESVPESGGRAAAQEAATRALQKGLSQVGIIQSKDYSSLAPGYLVVFTGIFDTAPAAVDHIADARNAGFHSAYERQIQR